MIVTLNADARQASNEYDRESLARPPGRNMEKAVNIARARVVIRTAAAVLLGVGVAVAPALSYAQHAGGGHMGGGGGGHSSGGGFHAAPSAPHFSGGHVGGYHGGGYGGAHYARPGYAGYGHGSGAYYGGHVGTAYWHGGHYWGGGYWRGGYWPHVYYGPGWAWFYPVLPLGYATFWWGGLPYYYYNNLYYTWNPNYSGYVVTDPPPTAGGSYDAAGSADAGAVSAAPGPEGAQQDYAPQAAPASGAASDVYVYPRNGQTEQQAGTDRYECHTWAVNQTGFDPTRSAQSGTGSAPDYRRAMIACLDARGYSAR